jgi:hypothetical protein
MTGAYGCAFINRVRKFWYNLTVTATSAAAALVIGGIEALVLIGEHLGLQGGLGGEFAALNKDLCEFRLYGRGRFHLRLERLGPAVSRENVAAPPSVPSPDPHEGTAA